MSEEKMGNGERIVLGLFGVYFTAESFAIKAITGGLAQPVMSHTHDQYARKMLKAALTGKRSDLS